MSLHPSRFVSSLVATLFFCVAPNVGATNSIRIDQIYSNLDGSVQYIQLRETGGADGQGRLAGLKSRSEHKGVTKEFVFPADLSSDMTTNEWVLIATTDCVPFYGLSLEAVGEWNCIAPDIRIPERFLPTDGGTIDFIGVDQISYASLPTDGVKALDRSGNLVAAMARAFQTLRVIVAYNATNPNNVVPFWLSTPVVVTPTPITAKESTPQRWITISSARRLPTWTPSNRDASAAGYSPARA